ncbi:MAG: TetR family transcriptional regulator [Acidiferrobacterales bacterium]|nr:TetR family transcriptional regulator [Acidiferrobacterales bacterium]
MSKKRQELEAIAADFVQRSGLHNLSFRTLANEVGVKSSSVHYYFPEKSHLASALIENYTEALKESLDHIDARGQSLPKKLNGFIKIFEDVIKDNKLCLCGILAADVSTLDEPNRKLLAQYFSLAESWLSDLLSLHKKELKLPIEPVKLSKIILSGLEGAILLDGVDGGRERLKAQRDLIKSLIG